MLNSSKLLIDESPLQFQPSLACAIGVNEAIFLQQLHYWLKRSNHFIEGRYWIYKTVKEWNEDTFPFWSTRTINRVINSLKTQKVMIISRFNKAGFDKTNWYSIDYDSLNQLVAQRLCQNGITSMPDCHNGVCQNGTTNTNRLHNRLLQENTYNMSGKPDTASKPRDPNKDTRHEIIDYWNTKYNRKFKPDISNTKKKINARLAEGFEIEDFKKVIDFKSREWKGTEYEKYLVPDTLFSEKFEKYVSQAECRPGSSDLGEYSRGDGEGLW